jgi:hypothetical protein
MALDITGLAFFNPLFSFVLLFVIAYAVLDKIKIIGENKAINVIVAAMLAVIFATVLDVRNFAEAVIPWFGVLVIAMFFILFMAAFLLGKADAIAKPWLAWVFIVLLAIAFLYKGWHIFDVSSNSDYQSLKDWLYNKEVAGSLWLIIFAAVTGFAITRKVK